MNFSKDELEYLSFALHTASSYTIARGEQIITPGVKHKELKQKIEEMIYRLTLWTKDSGKK